MWTSWSLILVPSLAALFPLLFCLVRLQCYAFCCCCYWCFILLYFYFVVFCSYLLKVCYFLRKGMDPDGGAWVAVGRIRGIRIHWKRKNEFPIKGEKLWSFEWVKSSMVSGILTFGLKLLMLFGETMLEKEYQGGLDLEKF